jgi:hypothetical protein
LAAACVLVACSGDDTVEPTPPAPLFPTDFQETYKEARDCRFSHDHELRSIRVFADDAAYDSYVNWSKPYPPGATLVKLEYDDTSCENLIGYSVMQRLVEGSAANEYDWAWQKLDAKRRVERSADIPERCVTCHEYHCRPPYGYFVACGEDLPF